MFMILNEYNKTFIYRPILKDLLKDLLKEYLKNIF